MPKTHNARYTLAHTPPPLLIDYFSGCFLRGELPEEKDAPDGRTRVIRVVFPGRRACNKLPAKSGPSTCLSLRIKRKPPAITGATMMMITEGATTVARDHRPAGFRPALNADSGAVCSDSGSRLGPEERAHYHLPSPSHSEPVIVCHSCYCWSSEFFCLRFCI